MSIQRLNKLRSECGKEKWNETLRQSEKDKQKLRQHYAGLAMQGLLASDINNNSNFINTAKMAIIQADALIEELNKDK